MEDCCELLSGSDRAIALVNSQQLCSLAQDLHKLKWVYVMAPMEKGHRRPYSLAEHIVTVDG